MTHEQVENQMVTMMLYNIQSIYKNKSSDEYKMAGDITKSPEYKSIEKMVTDLTTIKGYPSSEAKDIKTMFGTLHKPVFKECVEAYLNSPDERNALYTAMFTVGYRVLVGELARIYTSTEATEKGIVYKPDKISRRADIAAFIKSYDKDLNRRIDEYIRDNNKGVKRYKEFFVELNPDFVVESEIDYNLIGATAIQEAGGILGGIRDEAVGMANSVLGNISRFVVKPILGVLDFIFKGFKEINPISFINACLMNSYQKNVDAFHSTKKAYEEAQRAYEDYMKLPASKRKAEVEEKYKQMIEKYNIAVENLGARIKDYDQRSIEEAEHQANEFPTAEVPKKTEEQTSSTPSDDDIGF